MKFRRKKESKISALDITPLVDVVFLLLIFFMLSFGSPLVGSKVELPEVDAKDGALLGAEKAFSVVITDEGILLDGEETTTDELAALPDDLDILIMGQRDVAYYKVIDVLDVLRSSGHQQVSLVTKAVKN